MLRIAALVVLDRSRAGAVHPTGEHAAEGRCSLPSLNRQGPVRQLPPCTLVIGGVLNSHVLASPKS